MKSLVDLGGGTSQTVAISEGGIAMSQDLGRLLLKALNALPVEEQGELLVQLLGRSTPTPWPGPLVRLGGGDTKTVADMLSAAQAVQATRRVNQASPSEPELKVLPVRMPAADYERLRDWSKSHDFSMAVIVRTLVERFLDGQEPKT